MQKERVNLTLEATVNRGITATVKSGVVQGIKIMGQDEVPIQIALRVILGPDSRRSTDFKI